MPLITDSTRSVKIDRVWCVSLGVYPLLKNGLEDDAQQNSNQLNEKMEKQRHEVRKKKPGWHP